MKLVVPGIIALVVVALPALNVGNEIATGDGLGVATPEILDAPHIYLYDEKPGTDGLFATPIDSILIVRGDYAIEVEDREAKGWLKPLGDKLDYGIFFFRVVAMDRFAMQVVVDERSGETKWIGRESARFQSWAEFLTRINSVERIDKVANPLREAPDDDSGVITYDKERECLDVLEIRGVWMRVRSSEVCGEQLIKDAWIRWRADDKLLITYNLLS